MSFIKDVFEVKNKFPTAPGKIRNGNIWKNGMFIIIGGQLISLKNISICYQDLYSSLTVFAVQVIWLVIISTTNCFSSPSQTATGKGW